MKYIFFGTPQEATLVLDTLKEQGFLPSLIITAPDRPAGRGLTIEESPVALWGHAHNIEVFKPESLRGENNQSVIEKIASVDAAFAIVFAYGKIIPNSVLTLFPKGVLNIHPSLLPEFRGPAPVEGALLYDATETGVSIMMLDAEMDHGPIIVQEKVAISPTETAPELLKRLVKIGAEKLVDLIKKIASDEMLQPHEQNHSKATYTEKIIKANGEIQLDDAPELLYRKYRAYAGWPGLFFFTTNGDKKMRVSIKKARYENGNFIIERVVPEGKKEIDYSDFIK